MTSDRATSGGSSSFLSWCFFGEIQAPDNPSPSSLKELNKHRPLPVVPMNFLTRRQETRAGATGSKPPAAPCVPRVRVRSGVGPITCLRGSLGGPWVTGCQLFGPSSAEEEEEKKRGEERKGKGKHMKGKERRGNERKGKAKKLTRGDPQMIQ